MTTIKNIQDQITQNQTIQDQLAGNLSSASWAVPAYGRFPVWIRQCLGRENNYGQTARAVHSKKLHTVCEEARCPNRGECWSAGTATFMILGDTCTRACAFCSVKTGRPNSFDAFDSGEPERIVAAVKELVLKYVVLTSVNRDELSDGGAGIFALCISLLRYYNRDLGIELLTPDFYRNQEHALEIMLQAVDENPGPAGTRLIWGHNVETVPRLYREVRKGSSYERSLALLAQISDLPGVEAKSALMLGLGETRQEVISVLKDLHAVGVERIALGQYLRPGRKQLPVKEYIKPEEFDSLALEARDMGFNWVNAGPLVRSSYHAESTAGS